MTEKSSEKTDLPATDTKPTETVRQPIKNITPGRLIPWYAWVGGGAAAVTTLILLLIIYSASVSQSLKETTNLTEVVSRFIIPEAHAGDAFSVTAEKQDTAGTDLRSGFFVSSVVPITANDIEKHFRIMPPVTAAEPVPDALSVSVKTVGENLFLVTPDESLEPGKVYKLKLATAVQKSDGTIINRDFAWAIQTKNVFRVTSSVPGPNTASVPVNTAIEFTMSMPGWEDATSSFAIEPKVTGRFETHGRSLTFIPNKMLAYGQIYTVILKKGFRIAGSDSVLKENVIVKFETEAYRPAVSEVRKIEIHPSISVVVASPNKEIMIPTWYYETGKVLDITITAYKLNAGQASDSLLEEIKVPEFAAVTRNRGDVFAKYAKNKAAEFKASLENREYRHYLILPQGLPQGHYVMKIEPRDGLVTWFYLESTKVAAYAIADKLNTVLWTVNTETNRPLSELPVTVKNTKTKTDAQGVVKFATPEEVNVTGTRSAVIVWLGENDLETVIRLERGRNWWDYEYYSRTSSSDENVSYLYVDRPIYRPTDRAFAYGLVQNRQSQTAESGLTLELTRNGIYDFYDIGKEKVYRSTTVNPDASGFFKASLDWSSLSPGYYNLVLKHDGQTQSSQYVEIRDFQKPSYSLEVIAERKAVFAGEPIEGQVRATFYNGAPMSNLAVTIRAYGPETGEVETKLTTDESGLATFKIPTKQQACDPYALNRYCPSYNSLNIEVRPTEGEEALVMGMESVTVWKSRASLEARTETEGKKATINFTARQVDLSRTQNENEWNVLGEALRGKTITGKIIEISWEKIESGNYYDFLDKKFYPSYKYVRKEREVSRINLTTDTSGQAGTQFDMSGGDVSYRAVAVIKDDQGGEDYAATYFAEGWYRRSAYANTGISLEPNKTDMQKAGYHLGEKVSLTFRKNEELMPTTADQSYLYVQAQLGIRDVKVTNKPTYEFEYTDELVPNLRVYGIVYSNGGFVERTYEAGFDSQDRKLKLTVTSDQAAYAPGAKAKFHIQATTPEGKPAAKARIALGVVDEAVFAATYMFVSSDPLSSLYSSVSDGIILHEISHETQPEGMGGAERGGGGGGDQVRRNFKDTAAFETVTASDNGEADIEINLPDNLTRWRVTTIAITPDRYAGDSRLGVPVTKPVFVEAVLPSLLLLSDKPVMKLRAFGTGLKTGEQVIFGVDAPTLGLKNETINGTAGSSTYMELNSLASGNHALIIRVKGNSGSDAFEKKINVVSSRFLRDEMVQTELGPGVKLPDSGESREVTVSFVPKTRAQFLPDLHALSSSWRERLESQLAGKMARAMLIKYFDEKYEKKDESLLRYQRQSGGLAILPYSSEDIELTSKIASIAPHEFDKNLMAKYLWDVAQKKDLSREEGVRAVSGLASLGEPVLLQLKSLAALTDLNWREQLALIRALHAAGDTESARVVYQSMMSKSEESDGLMYLRVDEKEMRYNIEATAEAAGMAWVLGDSNASKMNAWLNKNWNQDAFTVLDQMAYLSLAVPAASGKDVLLGYSVSAGEQTLKLENGWSESVVLTAEEAKNFIITKVDGPVMAVFTRSVASLPKINPDISLKRTYAKPDGTSPDTLAEGDTVVVKLSMNWTETAQSGCYNIRDFVPAGLAPMVSVYFDPYSWFGGEWYPSSKQDNEVSFVACKPYRDKNLKETKEITYRARAVARGAYTAEPAIMQSEEAPSVAALSSKPEEKVTVTIK